MNAIEQENADTFEDVRSLEVKYRKAVPAVRYLISKRIERGTISNRIKKVTGFKCQACEFLGLNPHCFTKKDGEPYIEAHHVLPVSQLKTGSLSVCNILTLCPNHHRQCHYGNVQLLASDEEKFVFLFDGKKIEIGKIDLHKNLE